VNWFECVLDVKELSTFLEVLIVIGKINDVYLKLKTKMMLITKI